MHRDDDRITVLFNHVRPPLERLQGDHATGVAAERAAAHRLRRLVAVAEHQEQQVAHPERVPFPGPAHGIRTGIGVHAGVHRVRAQRIDPLLPPPGIRFGKPTAIMVSAHRVHIFAPVLTHRGELPADLASLGVARQAVMRAGHVADVDGNVPVECRTAVGPSEFRLPDGLGQAFPAELIVGTDVGVSERPQPKVVLLRRHRRVTVAVAARPGRPLRSG